MKTKKPMYPITYAFKKECVTMIYNKQYIAFTAYTTNRKGTFRHFSRTIEKTKPQDINKVFRLARINEIHSHGGHRTVIF